MGVLFLLWKMMGVLFLLSSFFSSFSPFSPFFSFSAGLFLWQQTTARLLQQEYEAMAQHNVCPLNGGCIERRK